MMLLALFILLILVGIIATKPKTVLVTFADKKYANTLDRLKKEALSVNLFDNVYALNEKDLASEFVSTHKEFINNNQRGYGYWIWKPQVIKQTMDLVPENSIVVYCDAGCSIQNKEDIIKLITQIDDKGILAFQWDEDKESSWSKTDTINKVYPSGSESSQIIATAILFRKCKMAEEFVNEWLSYCEDYHLVDDSQSNESNAENFKEHRHDQSIFSLLCKKHGIKTIPNTVDRGGGPIKATRIKN